MIYFCQNYFDDNNEKSENLIMNGIPDYLYYDLVEEHGVNSFPPSVVSHVP